MTSPVGGFRPAHPVDHTKHQHNEPHLHQGKNGRIVLEGTGAGDQFNVRNLQNGYYGVNVAYGQGQSRDFTFTKDQMSRLTINARGGADQINVSPNVDVGIRVRGGAGDDRIVNGANGTQISGGRGNDVISNTGSGVRINGNAGSDQIASSGNGNAIRGGLGRDAISVAGNSNAIDAGRGDDGVQVFGSGNSIRGGRGADTIFANGNLNNIQGNRGWDQIGVLGYGNVAGGGLGRDDVRAIGAGNQVNGGGQRGDKTQNIDVAQLFRQLLLPLLQWNAGYGIDPRGWGC